MKVKIFMTLFLISSIIYSQTDQLEKEYMLERLNKGEISNETFQKFIIDWQDLIKEIGGYPELPYDKNTKQIRFESIYETGQSKKINFNRILEWSALSFGSLSSVLHYKDYESGKIILKGSFDVTHKNEYKNFWGKSIEGFTTTKCSQTYVFTIKDDIIKTEVVDVNYLFKLYQYNPGGYVSDRIVEFSINTMYPITSFERNKWEKRLDMLHATSKKIQLLMDNLNLYIKSYDYDYSFKK